MVDLKLMTHDPKGYVMRKLRDVLGRWRFSWDHDVRPSKQTDGGD
jgi:hypothetical protein